MKPDDNAHIIIYSDLYTPPPVNTPSEKGSVLMTYSDCSHA